MTYIRDIYTHPAYVFAVFRIYFHSNYMTDVYEILAASWLGLLHSGLGNFQRYPARAFSAYDVNNYFEGDEDTKDQPAETENAHLSCVSFTVAGQPCFAEVSRIRLCLHTVCSSSDHVFKQTCRCCGLRHSW